MRFTENQQGLNWKTERIQGNVNVNTSFSGKRHFNRQHNEQKWEQRMHIAVSSQNKQALFTRLPHLQSVIQKLFGCHELYTSAISYYC